MKKAFYLPALLAATLFCSCQKSQTDAERNAEIERKVQERLAAEKQSQEQQQLTQAQIDLDQRVKGLENSNNTATATPTADTQAEPERENDRRPSVAHRMPDESNDGATASYSTFYTRLEPHGVWRETSNYGYVWQPRVAQESRDWRPYTNGRWVYTDAGWTWISDEPFGWATYHYGRWTRLHNIGWVWVPGNEWAPAWVSWRTSNDYVGWAPLPPEARFERGHGIHNWADNYYDIGPDQYSFVPTNELGEQRVERAVVPIERNVTIITQTTNVTNITYNNTMVVNQGPNYDEMRSRSRQPIERLRLQRDVSVNFDADDPRPVVRGEVVQVPGPVIARAQAVERPRAVKETVAEAVVDHGWDRLGDRQAAEKARLKMKSEATPPPNAPSRTFVKPAEVSPSTPSSVTSTPVSTAAAVSRPTAAAVTASPESTATPRPSASVARERPVRTLSVMTPTPTAAFAPSASPHATAVERTGAAATPVPSASPTPSPAATAITSPSERPTHTMTPVHPRRPYPSPLATPSLAPSATPAIDPSDPRLGRGHDANQVRDTERELRQQQAPARRLGTPPPQATAPFGNKIPAHEATSANTPPSTSSPSPAASAVPFQRKEGRRPKNQMISPSPTPTPFAQ